MKKKYQYSDLGANTLMGQHFLTSEKVVDQIVAAANVTKNDIVLEIGPGKGVLTEKLISSAKKVIAIEKDSRFVEFLKNKFQDFENFSVIEGDVLDASFEKYIPKKYKVVANIPYYITSRIIRNFLEAHIKPESITIMIQYEVARRITARPPEMNLLALSVLAYGTPRTIQKVPRSFFKPQPNVDSAIITITDIRNSFFEKNKISADDFFSLAKKAFSQKRKKLRNTIGVDSDKRPQELSLEDWVTICHSHTP